LASEVEQPHQQHGRRCAIGCESWPDDEENYGICPICHEQTTRYSNLYPLSEEEAWTKKVSADFEDFYENVWPDLRPASNPEMEECSHLLQL
jgi:hypothetical protein